MYFQTVNATSNKGGIQGIYQKLGVVNVKTNWILSVGKAVWFSPTYEVWFFGPTEYLGQDVANLISISLGSGNHNMKVI